MVSIKETIIMKNIEQKTKEKEKELSSKNYVLKNRKTIKPAFIWWGWKTA